MESPAQTSGRPYSWNQQGTFFVNLLCRTLLSPLIIILFYSRLFNICRFRYSRSSDNYSYHPNHSEIMEVLEWARKIGVKGSRKDISLGSCLDTAYSMLMALRIIAFSFGTVMVSKPLFNAAFACSLLMPHGSLMFLLKISCDLSHSWALSSTPSTAALFA